MPELPAMTLYFIAFAGGMLTLLSPCILPVLPFIFSRGDRSFAQGSLPLLAGMVLTFTAVASLGAVAGAWAADLNQFGRWLALALLALLALFAASLIFPDLAAWWSRPLVDAGERLTRTKTQSPWLTSAVLGAATGLVWSPCAGPILGVILSSAALAGPSVHTSVLLLSYGAGASVALWATLKLGSQSLASLMARLVSAQASRRMLGAAMLASVVAVAAGFDTTVLANVSGKGAVELETELLQRAMSAARASQRAVGSLATEAAAGTPPASKLPMESTQASLDGGTQWLNAERPIPRFAARQSRAGEFLDLLVHQLPAHAPLRQGLVAEVWRPWAGRRGRARPGVRLREGCCQRPEGAAGLEHLVPGGTGQPVPHLACLRQPVLAGALLH
jgi:cytochrome c biogenesis protein CcdA